MLSIPSCLLGWHSLSSSFPQQLHINPKYIIRQADFLFLAQSEKQTYSIHRKSAANNQNTCTPCHFYHYMSQTECAKSSWEFGHLVCSSSACYLVIGNCVTPSILLRILHTLRYLAVMSAGQNILLP